jgi:hypothetical protein
MGWFVVIIILQDVIRPCNWEPVCHPSWGHIFTSLHLGSGFCKLLWRNSNSGRHPHYLYSFTQTPFTIISLRGRNRHPWKWACLDRWSVNHPWKWNSSVDIGVGLEVILLFFCLRHRPSLLLPLLSP